MQMIIDRTKEKGVNIRRSQAVSQERKYIERNTEKELYVLIMSRTRFRVNPRSIVA